MVRTLVRSIEVMPAAPPMLITGSFVGTDAMVNWATGEPTEPWMILPTGLVAVVCMIFAPRFRRLGDLVAGTCVVYEHRGWRPGLAVLEDSRTVALSELIPADFRVRRELARAISSYVHKRRYLTVHRRREIARYVAEPLLRRFGMPGDTSYDLLLCAIYHRTFVVELEVDRGPTAMVEGNRENAPLSPVVAAPLPSGGEYVAMPPIGTENLR